MNKEIWKKIKDFSNYQVSNYGNIKNIKNNKILKQQKSEKGYLRITLFNDYNIKKTLKVHRLVAQEFIPNIDNLPQINHKDGNKLNNYIDNLEWCNNSYNQKEAYRIGLKKLKPIIQYDLNGNFINEYKSCSEASKILNLKTSGISRVCNGDRKKYHNFIWKFKEE